MEYDNRFMTCNYCMREAEVVTGMFSTTLAYNDRKPWFCSETCMSRRKYEKGKPNAMTVEVYNQTTQLYKNTGNAKKYGIYEDSC